MLSTTRSYSQPNPDTDVLSVKPVLVEDPGHCRYMTLGVALMTAEQLQKFIAAAYAHQHNRGRTLARDEKRIHNEVADLQRSIALLDQIGWR